jgi:type IV pilus assembly protein PilO
MAISKEDILGMPKWQRVLILVGVIVVIGALWYFFLFSKTQKEIEGLKTRIARIEKDIQKLEKAKATKRQLAVQMKELREQLKLLRSKLPEEKEIPQLLSTVSEVGRLNGLTWELFQQRKAVRKDYFSEIPVQIKVTGGYHEVAQFMAQVGKLDRIMHFSNMKMGKYTPANNGGAINTSMQATTYKYESKPLPKKAQGKKGRRK